MQRLKRRNGTVWEDSASLKITFSGSEKVQSVTIGKSFYHHMLQNRHNALIAKDWAIPVTVVEQEQNV